jgi:hypothetical protein
VHTRHIGPTLQKYASPHTRRQRTAETLDAFPALGRRITRRDISPAIRQRLSPPLHSTPKPSSHSHRGRRRNQQNPLEQHRSVAAAVVNGDASAYDLARYGKVASSSSSSSCIAKRTESYVLAVLGMQQAVCRPLASRRRPAATPPPFAPLGEHR